MINGIITEYIARNKRLVIPGFGAFIRKDTGEVVLVEFLKKDDGVLISLITGKYGIGKEEAIDRIEQYVAGVKRSVSETGGYSIEGLGRIFVTNNGLYELEYIYPQAGRVTVSAPANTMPERPQARVAPERTAPHPSNVPVADNRPADMAYPTTAQPSGSYTTPDIKPTATITPSIYGTPGVRPEPEASPRPVYKKPSYQPEPYKKKRTDMVMIIAILAAIIALAAIGFNLLDSPASQMLPINPPVELAPDNGGN